MCITISFRKSIILVCGFLLCAGVARGSEPEDIDTLLDRAQTLLGVGVVDKGASRSFEEARVLVETAKVRLAKADLPATEKRMLSREIEAVEENLEIFTELYEERFYGIFPLARLIARPLVADEGFAFTEQLYHPPDVAAVSIAMQKALNLVGNDRHPHVVITSQPADRYLENIALEVLLRDGRSTPIDRRTLVKMLSAADLDAFDRGEIDLRLVDRILTALDAVNLIVLMLDQPVELGHATVKRVRGDSYIRGEVLQGSPTGASLSVRRDNFEYIGFAQDRRDQYWAINATQLVLFLLSMAWAALVPWGTEKPKTIFHRLSIGAALFVFGRLFMVVIVMLLRRIVPESTVMAAAAWWWPALLGLFAILGGGFVAWIGQARLTDIVPGARGARAVGTIFALTALGACSYFAAPMLLLDESHGFVNVMPLVLASVMLAVVFGFAARTGPPVPHYFMAGPLLLAPLTGVGLLMASPQRLWTMVALSTVLSLCAWIRHRVMVARGTEEAEPSPEEAAQADQQKLVKLSQKLIKKL